MEAPGELFHPTVIALADKHKRALVALWRYYAGRSRVTEAEEAGAAAAGAGAGSTSSLYGCSEGLDVKRFVTLFADYDAAPTFLSKRELKHIFGASCLGEEDAAPTALAAAAAAAIDSPNARLSYPAFVEALGRAALRALGEGKPKFHALYPTPVDKLQVVLEVWGLADARKLGEVQRRNTGWVGGGGSSSSASSVATSVRR